MTIIFNCECGYRVNLKDILAGKKIVCPQCKRKVRLPPAEEKIPDNREENDVDDILKYADTSKSKKEEAPPEKLDTGSLEDILEKKDENLIDLSEFE